MVRTNKANKLAFRSFYLFFICKTSRNHRNTKYQHESCFCLIFFIVYDTFEERKQSTNMFEEKPILLLMKFKDKYKLMFLIIGRVRFTVR